MKKQEAQFYQQMQIIFSQPKPEIARMAAGFHWVLDRQLADSKREMELLRALGDREGLVKEQIKHNTIQHTARIFDDCYFRATGQRWHTLEESHV